MSENKYYTPKIEEFCKNFEYEYNVTVHYSMTDVRQEYTPSVFGSLDNIDSLLTAQAIKEKTTIFDIIEKNINKVRVKYLNVEDIESFGFKEDNYYDEILDISPTREPMILGSGFSKDNIVIECKCYSPKGYGFSDVCTTYVDQNSYFSITRYHKTEKFKVEEVLFSGKIKNKSELKRILEQIGVLKDE